MKRIFMVLAVAAVMAMMVVATAAPAFAAGGGTLDQFRLKPAQDVKIVKEDTLRLHVKPSNFTFTATAL